MPAGDRTGPKGMGPMRGKAAGSCFEHQTPGSASPGNYNAMGRGYGRRFGMGPGRCWRGGIAAMPEAAPAATREQEIEMLKQQSEYFKTASEEISARIKDLETPAKGD
jgi:hypothetical protein